MVETVPFADGSTDKSGPAPRLVETSASEWCRAMNFGGTLKQRNETGLERR